MRATRSARATQRAIDFASRTPVATRARCTSCSRSAGAAGRRRTAPRAVAGSGFRRSSGGRRDAARDRHRPPAPNLGTAIDPAGGAPHLDPRPRAVAAPLPRPAARGPSPASAAPELGRPPPAHARPPHEGHGQARSNAKKRHAIAMVPRHAPERPHPSTPAAAKSSAPRDARFELDPKRFPTLAQLGRNLTAMAARGELDPVVGRDEEDRTPRSTCSPNATRTTLASSA